MVEVERKVASLEHDPASGCYRVRFRYGGKPYKRSLKTIGKRVATWVKSGCSLPNKGQTGPFFGWLYMDPETFADRAGEQAGHSR